MMWFDPEAKGGFDLGTPDWSGSSAKVAGDEQVASIVIGQKLEPPKAEPQMSSPPPPVADPIPEPAPPPPPPEPKPDPRVENTLKLLAASISELAKVKEQTAERDLTFCVEMAFAIAEQLACGKIEANRESVLDIVRMALGMFDESDRPTVRLHPDILATFKELALLDSLSEIDAVTIKADPAVSAMGCVVTANKKTVNGQVLSRLSALKTLFELEQGGGGE